MRRFLDHGVWAGLSLALFLAAAGGAPAKGVAAAFTPATQATPDVTVQKAVMARLAFLHGSWVGINTSRQGDGGIQTSRSRDIIRPAMGGLLLTIEGAGFAPDSAPDSAPVSENYAVFRFDDRTGRLLIDAYANGSALKGSGRIVNATEAEWTLEAPGALIHFTAHSDHPDSWTEVGTISIDGGAHWSPMFEIGFKRTLP